MPHGPLLLPRGFRLHLIVYILLVLCAFPLATSAHAQQIANQLFLPHAVEPQPTEDLPAGKDAKKAEKYNVDRIGRRGIGHGFNLYSFRREHELGEHLAASFDRASKLITDPVVNEYVNRLAQGMVRYSDAEIPFSVKVIDSGDIPRAYGLPGGFLYVSSALILASDGEAELAGVMAHEIAHVAARHATRALTRRQMCNIVDSVSSMAGPASLLWQDVGGPLSLKKFARNAEFEADLLGIEYAWAAGYDPQALLDALEKLHAMEVRRTALFSKIPGYQMAKKIPFHSKVAQSFASYPLTEERIARLQSEMVVFLPSRKDYILDTNDFEEVKARLLSSRTPVLHHRDTNDDKDKDKDGNGPVLRRHPESTSDMFAP
ncbi:MAG: peptidase M48 [Acidobacteria bacterium]|nr:MAG: peptidase M48 [Acidobacteriota bacterium]